MTAPLIAYPDGVESARISPWEVAALVGLADPEVLLGWNPQPPDWIADPRLGGVTIMGGYGLASAIAEGRIRYLPVRLGAIPHLVQEVLHVDVAVVAAVPRGSGYAYKGTVGWAPATVAAADTVVVEVDAGAVDLGGPMIEGTIDHLVEVDPSETGPAPAPRTLDDLDRAIGAHVVDHLPDLVNIQLGPGGIAEAIVSALDRPVGIRSGLITESMAELAGRGLLRGRAFAGYVWGGDALAALAADGGLELHPVEITHDLGAMASTPGFVGCNTAVQLGLDGSVNVERVGNRLVAGIGGHADFCAGASRSPGGLSIIALRSVTRKGESTVVPTVDCVSTPRCDVDLVVTEHGVADLRGADDDERARRITAVAAPDTRDDLERAWASR